MRFSSAALLFCSLTTSLFSYSASWNHLTAEENGVTSLKCEEGSGWRMCSNPSQVNELDWDCRYEANKFYAAKGHQQQSLSIPGGGGFHINVHSIVYYWDSKAIGNAAANHNHGGQELIYKSHSIGGYLYTTNANSYDDRKVNKGQYKGDFQICRKKII